MPLCRLLALALASALLLTACDRPTPPPPAPAPRPAAAPLPAASSPAPWPPPTTSAAVPSPATLPAPKYPEDLTLDPDRDPRVRARAEELHALRVEGMKTLKAGDEAVILVRGDRGGGSIYGSGPYTYDSHLRAAVVHAGVLADRELGLVRLHYFRHEGEHPSVPAHGITPTAWGRYDLSYSVEKIDAP